MKIYSWNVLYRNRELDRAFEFITKSDFDIFCLQEVPEAFLSRLQTLHRFIAFRTDVERIFGETTTRNYVVVLSKNPTTAQSEIPYPDYWPFLPWRTRLFVNLMPSRFFSRIRNRGGLYVDVTIQGKLVRVFNLHLVLSHPARRLKEFETAMAKRDASRPTIVCGDFNTLEKPHITGLNWILGGRLRDFAFYNRERTHIEERFVEHALVNALSGKVTNSVSRSQLDHILLSRDFHIKKAEVIRERYGSDHHPILVETA